MEIWNGKGNMVAQSIQVQSETTLLKQITTHITLLDSQPLMMMGTMTAISEKIDSNGNLLWQKTFGDYGLNEYFRTIIRNIGGNYLAAGSKDVDIGHDSILEKDWAVCIDTSGNLLF